MHVGSSPEKTPPRVTRLQTPISRQKQTLRPRAKPAPRPEQAPRSWESETAPSRSANAPRGEGCSPPHAQSRQTARGLQGSDAARLGRLPSPGHRRHPPGWGGAGPARSEPPGQAPGGGAVRGGRGAALPYRRPRVLAEPEEGAPEAQPAASLCRRPEGAPAPCPASLPLQGHLPPARPPPRALGAFLLRHGCAAPPPRAVPDGAWPGRARPRPFLGSGAAWRRPQRAAGPCRRRALASGGSRPAASGAESVV